MKTTWLALLLAVVALGAGSYAGWQKYRPDAAAATATLGQIELPDIEKQVRRGDEWLGKVVVVNHWATWCPPCREEIPLLIEYQERLGDQGLQIVGIAHDLLDATRAFSDSIGINYPSLVAIVGGGEIMESQGGAPGGALPFTAFFNRQGDLVSAKLGLLSEEDLRAAIEPLL